MEFNAENVILRTKRLKKEFGSIKALSEASGCSTYTINNFCSPAYLKMNKVKQATWEKYFGPWNGSTVENTEPDVTEEPVIDDIVEEAKVETPVVEEPATPVSAKKKARLVIEVPSLEELEETLASLGFRLEFIPR